MMAVENVCNTVCACVFVFLLFWGQKSSLCKVKKQFHFYVFVFYYYYFLLSLLSFQRERDQLCSFGHFCGTKGHQTHNVMMVGPTVSRDTPGEPQCTDFYFLYIFIYSNVYREFTNMGIPACNSSYKVSIPLRLQHLTG